jgi:hypothetical protein
MKLWQYVETHHEELGIALFVIPALLVGLAVAAVGYAIAYLLH